MAGKVTVVLDAQAGSCGKGKVVGYLAGKYLHDIAICNFMSNAGHTYVDHDGRKIMTQQLPTSIINPNAILYIGAEAAITPSILFEEILKYRELIGKRVVNINPNAVVIKEKHRKQEQELVRSGSTFKGCGAARADKVLRQAELFGHWWDRFLSGDTTLGEMGTDRIYSEGEVEILKRNIAIQDMTHYINNQLYNGAHIIVEGSQGCDLDINFGLGYPHVTSRQCHAGQLVADCGLSPRTVTDIYMIMRPYPIRISNETNLKNEDGSTLITSSGDYFNSDEITWEEVRKRCGAPDGIKFGEYTTVTKKIRRVFEMNWERLKYVTQLNRPTGIILNFAQYLDWGVCGATNDERYKISESKAVMNFIKRVELETGVPVIMVGTGERNCEMVEL